MAGESSNVAKILQGHAQALEAHFKKLLHRADVPAQLLKSIDYSLMAGGKRLRPTLVLECFNVCSGSATKNESALASAAAIELIHTFSLVHDDLPAMDDDDLRRGRPTNHKVFGEALAILAGDAMVTMAFELLSRDADADLAPKLILELAHAAGPAGMIGGQALDMAAQNQPLSLAELKRIHRLKTGALLIAACRLGAISARARDEQLQSLTTFGEHLGQAFQIIDDLLDVTSTPEQLGKDTHKDAARGKTTYPALMGVKATKNAADEHLAAAIDVLKIFGNAADNLAALARFVVERNS